MPNGLLPRARAPQKAASGSGQSGSSSFLVTPRGRGAGPTNGGLAIATSMAIWSTLGAGSQRPRKAGTASSSSNDGSIRSPSEKPRMSAEDLRARGPVIWSDENPFLWAHRTHSRRVGQSPLLRRRAQMSAVRSQVAAIELPPRFAGPSPCGCATLGVRMPHQDSRRHLRNRARGS